MIQGVGGSVGEGGGARGGGGGEGGARGHRRGQTDLAAIIQAAVGFSVTTAFMGTEDVIKAAVEACTAVVDSGKGQLSVTKAHLHHICGVLTNK